MSKQKLQPPSSDNHSHWAPVRPEALFVVQSAQAFEPSRPVAIFETPDEARAFVRHALSDDRHSPAYSVLSVPFSGVDGGFVVGAQSDRYRPWLRPTIEPTPQYDPHDG